MNRSTRPLLRVLVVALLIAGPPTAAHAAPSTTAPNIELVGQLQAASWIVMEAATGTVLGGHEPWSRRPVASTVKVLTALTVLEHTSPQATVVVGDEVIGVSGADVGLRPGDVWTVGQLLDALLIRSGNDAAEALAAHVAGDRDSFIELMRTLAGALGIRGATVLSPSGLDDDNLLSAGDLAVITRAALDNPWLRRSFAARSVELPGIGESINRNELLSSYPGATGVKTGYTRAAGNCLIASARRDGRELIVVVLGTADDPTRFIEASELLDATFASTRLEVVASTVELLVGGGVVRYELGPVALTVPHDAQARLALPDVTTPTDTLTASLLVDGEARAYLTSRASQRQVAPLDPSAILGRVLVDTVYAGLRSTERASVASFESPRTGVRR